ncbi:MAG: type II secretion system protein [Puniceicoccales bacterium]
MRYLLYHHPNFETSLRLPARSNKGFTLVELLISIATIAVLAGIIFAVTQSAIRSARKTATISNLRQIGAASQNYSNENAGRVIPYRSTKFSSNTTYFFQFLSANYLDGTSDAFIAPGDDLKLYTIPTKTRGPYLNLSTGESDIYYSFARNMELPKPSDQTFIDTGTAKNFSLPEPSRTALFFLTRQSAAMYRRYPVEYHGLSDGSTPTGTLVSFLDGSVREVEITALFEDTPAMRTLWFGYPDAETRQDY